METLTQLQAGSPAGATAPKVAKPGANPAMAGATRDEKLAAIKETLGKTPGESQAPAEGAEKAVKAPEEEGPKKSDDPLQKMLDEELGGEPDGEFVETVSHGGVEKPVMEILDDALFDVPFKGAVRQVKGIQKLYELAAMGLSSTERNTKAKQAILEAQKIISGMEAEKEKQAPQGAKTLVEQRFKEGMDAIRGGYFPNGQPIPDLKTQQQAIKDLEALRNWVIGDGNNSVNRQGESSKLSAEEIKEKVRQDLQREFEEQRQKEKRADMNERLAQETANLVGEVVRPFASKFVRPDGKTINERQYKAFVRETQETAAKYAGAVAHRFPDGFPPNARKAILERAAKDTLRDFVQDTGTKATEKSGSPALKGGSGLAAEAKEKVKSEPVSHRKAAPFTPGWFRQQRANA